MNDLSHIGESLFIIGVVILLCVKLSVSDLDAFIFKHAKDRNLEKEKVEWVITNITQAELDALIQQMKAKK